GVTAVKASAGCVWRPKMTDLNNVSKDNSGSWISKRVNYIDPQGRLKHMTRNKDFLTNYQELDGGFVAFGGSARGGKITGKGKIRTNNLDFEDVLFDESQVLLRVPRQSNMYSFDLKNVVPSGDLTCLFAKATIDESKLWHRRLSHVNSKIMNKLVKGNLVRGVPLNIFENDHTCVACQKGKQHKASCKAKLMSSISQPLQMLHMDLFGPTSVRSINHKTYYLVVTDDFSREMNELCGLKGIEREFSVARTPQQNGVVERKNWTLIEAARTMLADLLLPTVFWGEAVNTACYVLNRVLVTKSYNKTPYELIIGRPPSISFMRPFGCPVTILNTLDPLGKFNGKAEEGFLVSYKSLDEKYEDDIADDAAGETTVQKPASENEQALKNLLQGKTTRASSTNNFNTVSTPVNVARALRTFGDARSSFIPLGEFTNLPHDPLMPELEDTAEVQNTSIFGSAYDDYDSDTYNSPYADRVADAEADFNNMEPSTFVNPIPTTRVHTIYLKDQIIGDPRIEAIRLFLAYASFMNFLMYQMDVKSAFLYGIIEEEVYVSQPSGFVDPKFPKKVYKVEKALYGLHQAPKAWYETLSTYLLDNGFYRGQIDKTLFIKRVKGDILLDKFVGEILKKFGFSSIRTTSTPMETNKALTKDEDGKDVDVHLYMLMIGSLMYLISSRPDIMFSVYACSRFQVQPKDSYLNAVKRIFRYLKGRPKLGLWYPKDSPFILEAFSDSDYAGASLDRKFATGGCQFLGSRLISWQCKKKTVVANSTTEAEYIAASYYCGQVLWIQNQMLDYGYNFMQTKIHVDNESAIYVVKTHVYHYKLKYIEIRHHFIRDSYEKRLIEMVKIHIDNNVADLLTKAFDMKLCTASIKVDAASVAYTGLVMRLMISIGFLLVTVVLHHLVLLGKKENPEFHQIVDFLSTCSINYALTLKDLPEPFNDTYETPKHSKKHLRVNVETGSIKTSRTLKDSTAQLRRTRLVSGPISGIRACCEAFNKKNQPLLQDLFFCDKMEVGTTTNNNLTARLPLLNPGDYDLWLMRIEQYFLMTDYSLWEVIKNGNKVLKKMVGTVEQGPVDSRRERDRDERESSSPLKKEHDFWMFESEEDAAEYEKGEELLGKMEAKDMEVYKLTRADGSSSYRGNIQAFLRILDRQDLNDLYSLVQERFQDHPLKGHDLLLWGDLRMIFDPDEKDELWMNQLDCKLLS
ncbi:putative ribonuclease H-like domain-containing protein, partial [Tanacetum coccineum]